MNILNLSPDEEGVFRLLLVSGQLSLGELQFALNKIPNVVMESINSLIGKGLVRKVPGIRDRYVALLPIGSVKDQLINSASQVDALGVQLTNKARETTDQLKTVLDENVASFKVEVGERKDQFMNALNGELSGISSREQEYVSQAEEEIGEMRQSYDELLSSISLASIQQVETKIGEGSELLSAKEQRMSEKLEEIRAEQSSYKSSALESFPQLDVSQLDEVKSVMNGSVEQMTSTFKEQVDGYTSKVGESLDAFTASSQGAITTLKEVGTSSEDGVKQALGSAKETVSGFTEGATQAISTQRDGIVDSLSEVEEILQTTKEKVESTLSQHSSGVSQLSERLAEADNQFTGDVHSGVEEMGTGFTSVTESLVAGIDSHASDLEEQLLSAVRERTSSIEERLKQLVEKLIEETKQEMVAVNNELADSIKQVRAQVGQSLTEEKEKQGSRVQEIQERLKTRLSEVTEKRRTTVEEVVTGIKENVSALTTELGEAIGEKQTVLNSMKEELSEELSLLASRINETRSQMEEQLAQVETKLSEEVVSVFQQNIEQIASSLQQANNTLRQQAEQVREGVSAEIDQAKTSALEAIETVASSFRSNVEQIYSTIVENLRTKIEEIDTNYNKLIEHTASEGKSAFTEIREVMTSTLQDLKSVYEVSMESLTTSYETFELGFKGLAETQASQLVQQMKDFVERSGGQIAATYDQIQELGDAGNDKVIGTVKDTFMHFNQMFVESASRVADDAKQLASILDVIYQLQQQTNTVEIGTTHIIGTEANLQQVAGIISRIKSKGTLLVPEPKMVPEEQILALPRTAQLTIISYIDEVTDKEWIEKMHGAKANITLRSLSRGGYASALPDFIGCEREGEEILLAMHDEKAKTFIGITSLSEDFVKILGNIVIADYARGKSKQLQK